MDENPNLRIDVTRIVGGWKASVELKDDDGNLEPLIREIYAEKIHKLWNRIRMALMPHLDAIKES